MPGYVTLAISAI